MNYDKAFELVIGHEGGYVNNPSDPGGETKYGISKRSYPKLNIAELTLQDAKLIYFNDFWSKMRCDELPAEIRFHMFDAAVNSGVNQAIKWLQETLNVTADGVIGSNTLAAVAKYSAKDIALAYSLRRLEAMTKMRVWESFSRGWTRRIISNLRQLL